LTQRVGFSLKRHCEKNHQSHDKYKGPICISKLEELKAIFLTKIQTGNIPSLTANYELSKMITMRGQCYTEGAFTKQCPVITAQTVCPEKKHLRKDILLTRNTIY